MSNTYSTAARGGEGDGASPEPAGCCGRDDHFPDRLLQLDSGVIHDPEAGIAANPVTGVANPDEDADVAGQGVAENTFRTRLGQGTLDLDDLRRCCNVKVHTQDGPQSPPKIFSQARPADPIQEVFNSRVVFVPASTGTHLPESTIPECKRGLKGGELTKWRTNKHLWPSAKEA